MIWKTIQYISSTIAAAILEHSLKFVFLSLMLDITEPRHDKTNKMTVRPAKTQISLGIHPNWSELAWASAQSDQSLRYPHEESVGPSYPLSAQRRLWSIWTDWVFAERTDHFVGFVMRRLICYYIQNRFGTLAELTIADWAIFLWCKNK